MNNVNGLFMIVSVVIAEQMFVIIYQKYFEKI